MAGPVRVRRPTDQEGQKLRQIVRRGSTSSVCYRRAMMLPASAGGNRMPVIAQRVQRRRLLGRADQADQVPASYHRAHGVRYFCPDPGTARYLR